MNSSSQEMKVEFESIAFEYMDMLYRTALRMTKNSEEAEDLVQDTYLQAYRHFDKFQSGTNFKAWIFKILTNTFINKYRKKRRTPQHIDIEQVSFYLNDERDGIEETDIEELAEDNYRDYFDDDVNHALDKLSEEFRRIVLLSELEGLSYKEIASKVNIPLGTVMSRLFRGRKMLQKSLNRYARESGYIQTAAAMP